MELIARRKRVRTQISESYERMLVGTGWSVQRPDGVRRGEVGAHVHFEPTRMYNV